MQGLTDPPRDGFTADQVRALLTGDCLNVSAGLDLLDTSNTYRADISDYLVGGRIRRDNYAAVHGSCTLDLLAELPWGAVRVRPYLMVGDGVATTARFNLGVYVLTTPDTKRGETPPTYNVTGYDLLYLLQTGPADTYVAAAGTTYLQAVRNVVTASGIGTSVTLDGTLASTTLPWDMVWALDNEGASWLTIINDLLAAINYIDIYADQNGVLRSRPYAATADRPVEWTLDTGDSRTNIVGEDRVLVTDLWGAPNWWRFVRTQMATQPVEGNGIYTVVNQSGGPSSIDSVGRTIRKLVRLEAADQAALVAQGDKIVAEDRAVTRTLTLALDPLPCMWHRDVFKVIDADETDVLEATSWDLNLDGSPGQLVLGQGKSATPQVVTSQGTATVTTASPLAITMDGATTASTANVLDGATYALGARVTVTVRNPQPPLVQGTET